METKYFHCDCSRCNDPTELGTHMSSFLCTRCRKGLVVFVKEKDSWKCNQCFHQFSCGVFNATINHVCNLIDDLDKNSIKEIECMIKKLSRSLAPNHSFLIYLKQQLAVLYREENSSTEFLNKRKEICKDLLPVIGTLEPGISRLRGKNIRH